MIYYRYYTQRGCVTQILPISDVSASQWMKHLFCLVSQADSIPTRKGVWLMTSNTLHCTIKALRNLKTNSAVAFLLREVESLENESQKPEQIRKQVILSSLLFFSMLDRVSDVWAPEEWLYSDFPQSSWKWNSGSQRNASIVIAFSLIDYVTFTA